MIEIENHGALIVSSTYWGSDYDIGKKYFLSINAGAFRLLCHKGADIGEMRTAKIVVITIGPLVRDPFGGMIDHLGRDMAHLMFDDHSDSPFSLMLSYPEQFDRSPAKADADRLWVFSAWVGRRDRAHQVLNRPAFLRYGDVPNFAKIP